MDCSLGFEFPGSRIERTWAIPSTACFADTGFVAEQGVGERRPTPFSTYIMTSDTDNDGASRSQSPAEDSADQDDGHMAEHPELTGRAAGHSKSSNGQSKSASNAKDPLRPRRKKARRACFACQRAHLTCGKDRNRISVFHVPAVSRLLILDRR